MTSSVTRKGVGDSIEAGEIATGAVTTAKIADNAVDKDKLGILTTKGDCIVYGTEPTRMSIGTNDQVMTADSNESSGMKWAAASGGGDEITTSGKSEATASFTSSTGSWTDVTNPATLTLSGLTSGDTYTIFAWAVARVTRPSCNGGVRIDVNGTTGVSQLIGENTKDSVCLTHIESGVTGVTSVDIKLQVYAEASLSTTVSYAGADPTDKARINAVAFKTS